MRRSRTTAAALVVCGIVCGMMLLTGCQGRATGSVSGDVYLLMQNGDVKRGAGNTVALLANPGDSLVLSLGRICHLFDQQLMPLRDSTAVAVRAALLRAAVAEAPTGVNGHYAFTNVRPGRYALWAETTIGEHRYTWWAPIAIVGGDSLKKDLDNSTEARATLYCDLVIDSLERARAASAESLVAARQAAEQAAADAKARAARTEKLARREIASIELVPPRDTIRLTTADIVLSRTLVQRVRNGRGQEVQTYTLGFTIEYPLKGTSVAFFGDTLPLEEGVNIVKVFVDNEPAGRVLTYIVK